MHRRVLLLFFFLLAWATRVEAEPEAWPVFAPEMMPAQALSSSPTALAGLALLRFYQHVISPLDGPSCAFRPTCSAYAVRAVRRYGLLQGVLMAADRLERCNPYASLGHYPVDLDGHLHDDLEANDVFR